MRPANIHDNAEVKRWNDAMIDKYDLEHYHAHPNPLIRFIESRRVRKILRELSVRDDAETLEIGCGAGDILLRVPKGRLHAFDLSARMAELTARKVRTQFPERLGAIMQGDAQAWPEEIKKRRYTNIYCSEVIEHIPNPRKLIEEMHAVTDGSTEAVIVSTPNEPFINAAKRVIFALPFVRKLFSHIADDMTEEWHLSSFDISLMRETCKGLFHITKIQGAPFRWLPIRYVFTLEKIEKSAS